MQDYSQAPVERKLYMEIPKGYNIQGNKETKQYALKLHGKLMDRNKKAECDTNTWLKVSLKNWVLHNQKLTHVYSTKENAFMFFTLMIPFLLDQTKQS